ncbi:pyridoxamine 5'-phosphate oxidase family protein [Granulicoccus phenolivorans]|uniref:pyridoxamine 5'-phosphate oxidase family protein n=1 Tax=Granulicoccus phenolivorans TaxID=266854 RepID=UPI000420A724|nr:pyridoxamine 5'-phosphate oxidase family protein [Granulicoccus phenolivorans]
MDDTNATPPPEATAWDLLATQSVGRLATSLEREPDIFPVNFVVDGETLVFRTGTGTKLFELVANSHVAFETDSWVPGKDGWSVVVKGTAEVLEHIADIEAAEKLPLTPWIPTIKTHFVRITPSEVSVRRFTFGPEPELW